jgi:hypothetical protein
MIGFFKDVLEFLRANVPDGLFVNRPLEAQKTNRKNMGIYFQK